MKLSQIDYNLSDAKEFEILDPATGKSFESPAFISILSTQSKKGKTVQLELYRRIIELKEDKANLDENGELKEEIFNKESIKILAKLVTGFRGIEDDKGNAIKYSYDKACELLENEIIFDFVNKTSYHLGNFLKG